jgi:Spy/CpxP family protein refolding chaperone
MKKFAALTISILALATFTVSAFAQDAGPAGQQSGNQAKSAAKQRQGNMMQRLNQFAEKLDLTADQKTKLTTLRTQTAEQLKALRNGNSNRDEQRVKVKEIMKSHREKFEAILTPAQQQKLKDMMKQQQGKRNKGNRQDPPKV